MRIVTELMDRVFSDSTPQEFKDLVMEGIDKAFSEGSCDLQGEGYNLSFSQDGENVKIEDKLNQNEVTIAKVNANTVHLEGSATQPDVKVPKVEGADKPKEAPGSTQPDAKVDIEPAIVDKEKAGKDKHFSVSEAENFTFSDVEIENVTFSANECNELYERLQGTGDVNLAFSLKEEADQLKAYSVLAQSRGFDMSDVIEACEVYSEYADDVMNQYFSDCDINEFFSEMSEEEINQYFSGLDEVESQILYSALLDTENTYTFSEVEDIINETYSEIELSQSVQEAFSELSEEEMTEYFSQFTDQEANVVFSAIEDENMTFSELNEQLAALNTPLNDIFSEMSDEEIMTFSEDWNEDEVYAFSVLSEDETATFSDLLDAFEYVNSFSEADAATLVENTEELEKAAKKVTDDGDCELAKKVKVLAEKTSEDAESAREAGYEDLANEVQQKCQSFSEVAADVLDKAGVDPKSIDAEKIMEEIKEAKDTAEHADDKAGAAVQKAAEAKGEAAGAKADAAVAAEAAAAAPAPDKAPEEPAKPAEEPKKEEPKEEQKTHSKYAHVFGTETRAFSKGMPTKQTATPATQPEQRVFSESTNAPTKSKYSTLKSAIN
jgi:Mg/Co/Ni transporter MgtE